MTSPVEMAALTIATHHISPKRARLIAADVIADLQRIGWGGRPDIIRRPPWHRLCMAGACSERAAGLRWEPRDKEYQQLCPKHLDADGATGGAG